MRAGRRGHRTLPADDRSGSAWADTVRLPFAIADLPFLFAATEGARAAMDGEFGWASFKAWPEALQSEMQDAVDDAVAFQRELHLKEGENAAEEIRKEGGEIIELTPEQHGAFVATVAPVYEDARSEYGGGELLGLLAL